MIGIAMCRPRRLSWILLILLGLGAAAPLPAEGQEASTDTETPTGPQAPTGISVSRITVEAEKAGEQLHDWTMIAAPDPDIEQLKASLPEDERHVKEQLAKSNARLDDGLSFRDLDDLATRWAREQLRLVEGLDQTGQRSEQIDQALGEVQALRQIWEATLSDGQETIQNTIDKVMEAIRLAEKELGAARTETSEIRTPLREMNASVTELRARIDESKASRNTQLAKPDSPPLWSHPAWAGVRAEFHDHFRQSLRYIKLDIEEFGVDNRTGLLQQLLGIILLAIALVILNRRLSASDLDPDQLNLHSRVLKRPFSTAFVIGLGFTGFIYPQAPPVVLDLMGVMVLLPFYRILPEGMTKQGRFYVLSIWVLFSLGRLELLLPADSLLLRVTLIVQSLTGFVIFLSLSRRWPSSTTLLTRRALSIAHLLANLSWIGLTIAAIANILGYVALARQLNSATITGAYTAILLFGLFQALRGLIEIAPNAPLLSHSRSMRDHGPMIQRRATSALRWLLVLWLIKSYLDLLNLRTGLIKLIESVLNATAKFGDLNISLGDVLAFALTVYAASLVSRFLRFLLQEEVYPRVYLPRGIPNTISTILNYAILMLGFVLAVAASGMDLSNLTFLMGAFGVGIGFGLQDIVRNFVSGGVLLIERPIMAGDTIQTPQLWGTVKRIGIRSSTVRTWEGAEVIVPNADLVLHQVTNWTLSDRQRRMEVLVNVAYGSDPTAVVELLVEVAKKNDQVLESPSPYALFSGFGESSLDFSLRAWTVKFDDFLSIKSQLYMEVNSALLEAGYQIPFPQRDIHVLHDEEPPAKDGSS